MNIDFLISRFKLNEEKIAFIYQNEQFTFKWLLDNINRWKSIIKAEQIKKGTNVAIESTYAPYAIALLLALIQSNTIIIPFPPTLNTKRDEYFKIAEVECVIKIEESQDFQIKFVDRLSFNPLFEVLKKKDTSGLILFSSGSSGNSKAILHDLNKLLQKYKKPGKDLSTLAFMLYDHIGGIDTLFYSLSNASKLVLTNGRQPKDICQAVFENKIEVLPVTPTFLNLLLMSEAYKDFDLSSLKYITYGTEPMPEITLKRINEIFPDVRLLQKFGTTEVGTLRSKSKESTSTWVKIGGEGYETRIVDDLLQIKADSAMVGYLNAESPFTDDGWFITGDQVETDGEFYRILGRKSEIINVGGEKVYPAEVENIILEVENVVDCRVYGEQSLIMGNIVCADISLSDLSLEKSSMKTAIKDYCSKYLEPYKVPVKIKFTQKELHTERFKKKRANK